MSVAWLYRLLFLLCLAGSAALPGCRASDEKVPDAPVNPPAPSTSEGSTDTPQPAETKKDTTSTQGYGASFLKEEDRENRLLARVGDFQIRASDLFKVSFIDNPMKVRDVIDNIVLYRLVEREAARLGIRVREAEVEALLDDLLSDQQGRIALKVDERLDLADFVQAQYGKTMDEYRTLIRKTAVFHLLLKRCVRYMELSVKRLRIGIIIVRDLAEAGRIHKKLERGADFETLARQHSVDGSAVSGGLLPPLPAAMDYPVVQEAQVLEQGQFSEVEVSNLGKEKVYRILRLVEVLEPLPGAYSALREQVEQSLKVQPLILPDVIRHWQKSMVEEYEIEYFIP
jgi:hypothetical protein